jgi:probable HAF family extracellular repeat protein
MSNLTTFCLKPVWNGIALSFIAFLPVGGLSQFYSVTDLGRLTNLPAQNRSTVNALNYEGQVVGVNYTNDSYRAVRHDGAWTELGTVGGATSAALGLNNAGQVVGRALNSDSQNRAFLWTSGGTDGVPGNPQMKDLGTLGGSESHAYHINTAGQIAGHSQTSTGGEHAFRHSNGTMVDIHSAALGFTRPHSFGFGLNDAGHVVGVAYDLFYVNSDALFYNGTSSSLLAKPAGLANAVALAINNNGRVVGYGSEASNLSARAIRWDNGTATDLGSLGGNYSYALAINNSNVVVGGSFTDTNHTVYHAFVCVSNTLLDLNQLLDETGVGWELTEARAINDRGQIAGVGLLNGEKHAYLLSSSSNPPAPQITHIGVNDAGVIIEFTSFAGGDYFLQSRTNLFTGDWSTVIGDISGNPGMTTVTNPASGAPILFYRVGLATP